MRSNWTIWPGALVVALWFAASGFAACGSSKPKPEEGVTAGEGEGEDSEGEGAGEAVPTGPSDAELFDQALAIVDNPRELASRGGDAEKIFQDLTTRNPKNVHAWYNLGLLAYREDKLDVAAKHWNTALQADPEYLPAKARLAEVQYAKGDTAAAVTQLEAIVEVDRFQPEARNALAAHAIGEKRYDEAIKHARNVLLRHPNNINSYLNLAIAYYEQELYDQAGLIIENALKRQQNAAALQNLLGLVFLKRDDARNAAAAFEASLAIDPDQLDARLNLGALELSYGDFQKAFDNFDAVYKARPTDAMIVMSRAVALRGLEEFDQAAEGYQEVLRLKPDMKEAEYNLCVLHHQYTADYDTALKWCKQFQSRIGKDHDKWRELRRRIKSLEATIEALKEVVPAQPPGGGATTPPPGDGTGTPPADGEVPPDGATPPADDGATPPADDDATPPAEASDAVPATDDGAGTAP